LHNRKYHRKDVLEKIEARLKVMLKKIKNLKKKKNDEPLGASGLTAMEDIQEFGKQFGV
jgi:hypothetical protein